jgi:hypothetical protein
MKTPLFYSTLIAAALSVTAYSADDKTIGDKTSDTLKKAGEKTKEAGRAVVDGTKEAGRAVADGTKKAVDVVKDAVTPDADAKRVDVTLADKRVELPKQVAAGKTAFVVKNNGAMKQNFEIRGEGMEKKFLTDVSPNDSKTLHVDLKPGTYKVHIPESNGPESTILVK